MTWWAWMIIGAILLGAELFAVDAQFYLVFLGISAVLVGAADLLGLAMPEWVQWIAFAVLSIFFFFSFRKALYSRIHGQVEGFRDTLAGDSIHLADTLAPGAETRADYRGTQWTVRNIGEKDIPGGTRAAVVKVEGLTLHVSAE